MIFRNFPPAGLPSGKVIRIPEEREFYLRLAIREKWSSRELERQLKGGLFERTTEMPKCQQC